jgi:hypothetical protein
MEWTKKGRLGIDADKTKGRRNPTKITIGGFAVMQNRRQVEHPKETPLTKPSFQTNPPLAFLMQTQDILGLLISRLSAVMVGEGGLTIVMGGDDKAGLINGVMSCTSIFNPSPTSPLPASDLVSPISDLVSSSW